MTFYTLHEGFPALPIADGMKLVLNAIDPTTGDEVAGVTSSRWAIYGDDDTDQTGEDVVPLYTPEEVDDILV